MLFRNLFIDGDWIANGFFFKRVERLEQKGFMALFMGYEAEARETPELSLVSCTPEDHGGFRCIRFTDGEKVFFAQLEYLKEVGFDPTSKPKKDEPESDYTFKLNSEQGLIFVYSLGLLLGGVMRVDFFIEDEPF